MEPLILFFYGLGSLITIVVHEICTESFGYTMCKMGLKCCEEECMGDSGILMIGN
jgi:hypothetical protein